MDRRPRPWPSPGQGDPHRLDASLRGHQLEGPRLPPQDLRRAANRRPCPVEARGHEPRRTVPARPRPPPSRDDLRARTPHLPTLKQAESTIGLRRLNRDHLPLNQIVPPQLNTPLTLLGLSLTLETWQDSLRVELVITKSTHFVALPEYPRNSPHRAAWVSLLTHDFSQNQLSRRTLPHVISTEAKRSGETPVFRRCHCRSFNPVTY